MAHPRSKFEEIDIPTSPHIRKCRGAKHIYRLCPHRTFTFAKLRRLKLDQTLVVCLLECINRNTVLNEAGSNYAFRCQGPTYLAIHGEYNNISLRKAIQRYMAVVARYICPHMQTDDAHVQREILEGRVRVAGRYVPDTEGFTSPGVTTLHVKCPGKDCDTTLFVTRVGHNLDVHFVRNLGGLTDASDPMWCAQLEYPSEEGDSARSTRLHN
jgi:hypothetical protein